MTDTHSPSIQILANRAVISLTIGSKIRRVILSDEAISVSGYRAAQGTSETLDEMRRQFILDNLRRFASVAASKIAQTNDDADIMVLTGEDMRHFTNSRNNKS